MAITFNCEACGFSLAVAEDKAGKRGYCPKCKELIRVPMPKPPDPVVVPAPAPPPVVDEKPAQAINLIDCHDCHKRISRRATHCPHCGCPVEVGEPVIAKTYGNTFAIVVTSIITFVTIAAMVIYPPVMEYQRQNPYYPWEKKGSGWSYYLLWEIPPVEIWRGWRLAYHVLAIQIGVVSVVGMFIIWLLIRSKRASQ